MRQQLGSELPWVTLEQNPQVNPKLIFETQSAPVGDYQVTLESFDANSTVQSVLKTDIISI